MTPTFALDLSLDGIRLLFRAEGGWTVVGDVALEDPALPARLAALRAEAERVAPGAVTTELIIPPSQIRYATIPSPGPSPEEDQVRDDAAGLTPLGPEELVLDWTIDGDNLRLALLDRTTLDEAEAFAEAHGFNPVSFTARPSPDQFPRAPLFGRTRRAAEPGRVPPPLASPPRDMTPPPADAPPAVEAATDIGAEALARSLSAPHPDSAGPQPLPRPAPFGPRSRRIAATAVAAVLLLGVAAVVGGRPAGLTQPRLPDTPPRVTLETPDLPAPPATADAGIRPRAEGQDGAPPVVPASLPAAVPSAPDPADTLAPLVVDTAAPEALAGPASTDTPALAAAPANLSPPRTGRSEDIYFASIDPVTRASDAISLPAAATFARAPRPVAPLAPPPPGTTFDLGEDGLVRATPDGALTPDGVVVTQGPPPLRPPAPPARAATLDLMPTETVDALPAVRPRQRPGDLVERSERAALGGLTRAELAALGPAPRPISDQALAEAAQAGAPPSQHAVAASLLPRARPSDLASRAATAAAVAAALAAPAPSPAPAPAAPAAAPQRQAAAAPPPASDDYDDGEPEVAAAAPSIPTSASVARQATITNAIRLRDINLIGVYGTDRDRRALVRLSNGRYQKVKVGDRLDGGQIAAISRNQLRYTKAGRNITLTVPSG